MLGASVRTVYEVVRPGGGVRPPDAIDGGAAVAGRRPPPARPSTWAQVRRPTVRGPLAGVPQPGAVPNAVAVALGPMAAGRRLAAPGLRPRARLVPSTGAPALRRPPPTVPSGPATLATVLEVALPPVAAVVGLVLATTMGATAP